MAFAVRLLSGLGHRTLNHILSIPSPKLNLFSLVKRDLSITPALCMAMPVKRKRKMDPMVVRAREEKRKKRLAKALKKMEKKPRIARPLLELEPSVELIREAETRRKRTDIVVSDAVMNERAVLMKEWNRFSGIRHISEIRQLDSVIVSQQEALDVLREENEALYFDAIQPDSTLIPFQCSGPSRTPAIPDHFVDGSVEEITKKFSVQYADMRLYMTQLLARPRKKKKRDEDLAED